MKKITFIRKSFSSRNKEDIKNFVYYIIRSYGLSVLSILHIFILLKLIPVSIYGKMQYINAIIAVVTILTLTGAETSVIQNTASGEEYLFNYILKFRLIFSLIPVILTLGISYHLYYIGNKQIAVTLGIMGSLLPLTIFRMITSLYIGRKDFKTSMKIDILARIIFILSSIGAAVVFPQNLNILYIIPFLAEISIYIVGYIFARINKHVEIADFKRIKNEYYYIIKRTSVFIIPSISIRLDKIVVGSFFSFSDLAVFSVAKFCVEQLKIITQAIQKVYLQKFSSRPISELVKISPQIMFVNFMALFLFALMIDNGATIFINMFLYEKYLQTLPYIHLFVYSGILAFASNYFILKWTVSRSVKPENIFYLISTIVYTTLLVLLSYRYKMDGIIITAALRPFIYTIASFATDNFFMNPGNN